MNYVLGVVCIIILLFAYWGHCRGLAKEIASLVSLVLALLGLSLLVRMVGSYFEHNTNEIIQAVVFFVALAFLAQIINLIFASLKIITKIPIIHGLNSFLGMLVGIAEGVLAVWAIFIVISRYDIAGQSNVWLELIAENPFLSFLFAKNPFVRFFL